MPTQNNDIPSRIYLVGMPASGKTTFGQQLSTHLSYAFIDLDWELEKREGKSIPEIFASLGEDYFREAERRVLRDTLPENCVIATGGGAPCFFDNMAFINTHGKSIFLNTPLEILTQRAWKKKGERPLLMQQSYEEMEMAIKTKMQERLPFYKQAHKTILTQEQVNLKNIIF